MSARHRAGKRLRQIIASAAATASLCQTSHGRHAATGVATVPAFFGAGFQVGSSYTSGPGPWNPAGGPTASNTNNGSRGLYTSTANSNTTTANAMWVPVISGGGATNAVTDGGANNTT